MQDVRPSAEEGDTTCPRHPLRRPTITVRPAGGDLVLYDPGRGRLHVLNATAAAVWECCDGSTDAPGIAFRLEQRFAGGRRDRVGNDVSEVLRTFHRERLVIDSETGASQAAGRAEEA